MPDPAPAIPPFEPPPLPASVTDSGRRILWIIGLYRAVCGAALFGIALLVDLKGVTAITPNAFITGTALYFIFGLATFAWVQMDRLPLTLPLLALALLAGDIFFLSLVIAAGGNTVAPIPILLFPQLAASGWLLRTQTAFFHAALAAVVLLGLDVWRAIEGSIGGAQIVQTGIVGFGYFATVGIAVALGRYTKASEELAAQRGIDVANLEQVNRLIIQDMQDGVLVVDLNGVVRGHNAQVTRLLGGFGRMRGGMRLAEFSATLHDYWRRWQDDFTIALPPLKVDLTQRLLRVRLVRIGSGLNGGTLIYLEDLGRAQSEAQQMKLAAMGRLTASIAHEVRNPLSAINQAAQLLEEDGAVAQEGLRLLGMIRNNSKRIDRIVGEVLQLNRRDRQQPETIALSEFLRSLVEEIVQAENIPPGSVQIAVPDDLMVIFDRGHFNQIVWNLVRNAWQHCQKKQASVRLAARAGYMGDAVIFELVDDGPGIPAELRSQIFEPFFTTRPGGTGLGLYIARELADANAATLELLPKSPGAQFRMTLKRASTAIAAKTA
ncbi:MAG: HAMP domain-containing histidine kinase [Burkholderiales bacterium]|jgi:two-component system sensor histidine kinase PilS (NtrC family)|nr:HAMP domain-containing histidine kinase [Burkholderiales bacterium]